MNSTALEQKRKKTLFLSAMQHEKFYYEKLKEVRYQDGYHKALATVLASVTIQKKY